MARLAWLPAAMFFAILAAGCAQPPPARQDPEWLAAVGVAPTIPEPEPAPGLAEPVTLEFNGTFLLTETSAGIVSTVDWWLVADEVRFEVPQGTRDLRVTLTWDRHGPTPETDDLDIWVSPVTQDGSGERVGEGGATLSHPEVYTAALEVDQHGAWVFEVVAWQNLPTDYRVLVEMA